MKRLPKLSLLARVALAIVAGIAFGQFLPHGIVRVFVTFNSLFANFLSFSIPLIILGLVIPAIGELGQGAGRMLLLTTLIAYGSTLAAPSGASVETNYTGNFAGIVPKGQTWSDYANRNILVRAFSPFENIGKALDSNNQE